MSRETDHTTCADEADLPGGSVFSMAFESSRTVMFLLDPAKGTVISANPAARAFYGYSNKELRELDLTQVSLLPREEILALLHSVSQDGSKRIAAIHRLKNGELRDMEIDAAPVTLHSGRSCVFCIAHDVTELSQAKRVLSQREGLLRAILNSAGDAIGFKDAAGIYREANPAFCTMLGSPCEDILGRESRQYFDAETTQRHLEADARVLNDRVSMQYEMLYPDKEQGQRLVSVHKSPVLDADGNCQGVVFINRDVTSQRRAEGALRKSEGLLRAMLDSAKDSIFVTDAGDVLLEANPTFCRHLGLPRAALLDRPLAEIFEGDELRIQLSTNALARETGEPVNFTQRVNRPGVELWLSVAKAAVVDAEGRVLGVVSLGRDITEQRAAENALRQSERRLSSLIRQAPVGVFETSSKGQLIFVNERMQRMTGHSQAELLAGQLTDIIYPDDRDEFARAWAEALAHKRGLDRELRLLTSRGGLLWVSCRIQVMRDAASRVTGHMGVLGDISERKKAEILRADVESVVRHDLKSPLGSVLNALELLPMLGALNQEQGQVLYEVRGLAERMLGLITLSLDLFSIEDGSFVAKPEPLDLCAVLEELRPELRTLVEGKSLQLEIAATCGAEPFMALGERRLVDAVFSNLLKNAAEASPEGCGIQVRLWTEGREAVASIRNQGEVPKDIRGRFFEKYATSGKTHGTGLGTYSAKLMVRTLGGRVTVDTTEPGATTLTVHLMRPQQ